MSRRKGHAKRRRRKQPKLTPEELIALDVSRRAAENRLVARAERRRRSLLEAMIDEAPSSVPATADLTRWELCELARINVSRREPLLALPPSAYEASRLTAYATE